MGRAEVGRVEILLKSISQKKNVYKRFKFSATKVSFMPFITYIFYYFFYIWHRNQQHDSAKIRVGSEFKIQKLYVLPQ